MPCRRRAASTATSPRWVPISDTVGAIRSAAPKASARWCAASDDIHIADPLIRGGGQERGLRAGTENVAGIAAFGAAAAAARRQRAAEAAHMLALRDMLETGLRAIAPETVIFGAERRAAAEYDPVHRRRA